MHGCCHCGNICLSVFSYHTCCSDDMFTGIRLYVMQKSCHIYVLHQIICDCRCQICLLDVIHVIYF